MAERFSKRYGFKKPPGRLVRNEASNELREALLSIFARYGYTPDGVGSAICYLTREILEEHLGTRPTWYVVSLRMERLPWYGVYDLVETLCPKGIHRDAELEKDINELFEERGIGWKVVDGMLEERGDETHERLVQGAVEALKATGRPTAADEMKEAIAALSRRPEPDPRGAVNRAVGAVGALARDVTKDPKVTLGQLADKLDLPAPLDQAVAKLWGFASEQARHVREGQSIELDEAYLVANLCAVLASYLCGPSRGPS